MGNILGVYKGRKKCFFVCASNVSLAAVDLLEEELFSKFQNKIVFDDIKNFALSQVTTPSSKDVVRGIVAGPNNDYKAVGEDQSY